MSDDSDFQFSDDDFDDSKHKKIVQNVLNLNKSQHLKKPSRTEPTVQISEFNLVKSVTGQKGSVHIDDLAKVLKTRKNHVEISKRVESTKKKTHTLPKPLEKPQAERIRRSVGYEKNRFLFDRWEAFVTSNRAQAHQVFPLGSNKKVKVKAKEAEKFGYTGTYKSNLQKELEKINVEVEEYHIEDETDKNEFPLTLQELKEKRKETAKLRAHQSFKEAKARRQNKIKSKKYHRILRKEKIKQKLKEFEDLQKTNPEEALKKLEEIEKARALERFSLRHKGTGQWAKSKQVRAKYDKESRQVLAQQLQISRDLTQKQKHLGSDSEDEGIDTEETSNPTEENPWIGGPKPNEEVTEFLSGYKKFWTEQNKKIEVEQLNHQSKMESTKSNVDNISDDEGRVDENEKIEEGQLKYQNEIVITRRKTGNNKAITGKISMLGKSGLLDNSKIENGKQRELKKTKQNLKRKLSENKIIVKTSMEKKAKSNLNNSSGDWDIEEIFDKAEKTVEKKITEKLLKNKKEKTGNKSVKKTKFKNNPIENKKRKKIDLTIPTQSKKQVIDEEMIEQPLNEQGSQNIINITALKNLVDDSVNASNTTSSQQLKPSEDIDPDKFMKPKVTNLDSALPDLMVEDDNAEDDQKNIIMEAFEDNDIVDDFTKEKQDELNQDKVQDIDLNLPGWGSWAGSGINPKKQRKRRRFIVKMPEVMPRRDDNKGSLIINEKAAAKVKPHLVSEIPFPFKTVKDYEASIRAPIGNSFVPELAHRRYIRPAVETKMGAIIEPVSTSILMGIPNK